MMMKVLNRNAFISILSTITTLRHGLALALARLSSENNVVVATF